MCQCRSHRQITKLNSLEQCSPQPANKKHPCRSTLMQQASNDPSGLEQYLTVNKMQRREPLERALIEAQSIGLSMLPASLDCRVKKPGINSDSGYKRGNQCKKFRLPSFGYSIAYNHHETDRDLPGSD